MTTAPNFPACAAPTGSLIASYDSGTHGIVGSTSLYSGSDRVYQVSDTQVTQCFCSSDGSGIQTNWWKSSSLSQEQIDLLISQGWHYIPDGDLWGLSTGSYLAQNINYSCLPSASNPPAPTTTTTTSSSGGEVQGTGTGGAVLGLAATGNTLAIILVFVSALALIVIGAKRLVGAQHETNL